MKGQWAIGTAIVVLLAAGCAADRGVTNGEVAFVFTDGASSSPQDEFVAKTSNPDLIRKAREQLALPPGDRLHINGRLGRGNAGHNMSWSWHIVPDEWDLAEMSIELCDGRTTDVEGNLDYWIDTVGRFCPWSSRVARELD